ncbi:LTXXQ motif family protein [Rhizobiales bacterium GAS188]|nr:LTXXQ motif family protein [Rhizobiales bacterium GAS188]
MKKSLAFPNVVRSGDLFDPTLETKMNRLIVLMAAGAISLTAAATAFGQGMGPQGGRGFRSIERLCATDQQWTTERMGERLSGRLNLTEQQKPALKALQDAIAKAKGDAKTVLCGSKPDLSTLPARMAFAQKRLQARLDGMRSVQPKLEAFYAALTADQQAEFNDLWHRGRGGDGERRWRDGQGGGQGGQGGGRRFGPQEDDD